MIRQALRLVVINLSVLAAFLALAELASRGYESLVYKPKYQNELEKQLSEAGDSCHHPPIVTDGGNLSRYKEDFSCGGVTVLNGLRLTSGQPENPSQVVHVFGGSTVFGTGSRDEETIPSKLQNLLNDQGFNAEVKNYGFMTLVAAQQKAALSNAGIKKGDIVVFYDGGNDAFNAFVYGSPEGTIIGYNRQNKLSFAFIQLRHFLKSNSALYRSLGSVKAVVVGKDDPSRVNCLEAPSAQDQLSYMEHYLNVLSDSKELAESKGAHFFHAFQPVLGSSNGIMLSNADVIQPMLDVDGISWCTQDSLLGYYSHLGTRYGDSMKDLNGVNLSRVFASSSLSSDLRYIDWIHTTPKANQVIADRLMEHIMPALSSQ